MTRLLTMRNNRKVNVVWYKEDETIKLKINNQPVDLTICYQKRLGGNKLVAKYDGKLVGTSDLYNLGHFKDVLLRDLFNIRVVIKK